jgi:signal transduction histidine kinase
MVRIEQRVDEESVRVSPVRFHQALTNLLANAVRHGPVGGTVELEARLAPSPPGQRRGRPVVMVEVADRGPGIDPGARHDLFVPFALPRGDASTAHGLGLATAAAAVRSQEGEIGHRDRPGGGSIFWFWLPLAMDEPIAAPARWPR